MASALPNPAGDQVVDSDAALTTCAGDPSLLSEVAELFIVDAPRRLSALRRAISEQNAADLALVAHSLKGSVALFAASQAVEVAEAVESLAERGRVEDAVLAAANLEAEILRVVEAVKVMAKPLNRSSDDVAS